ncbi:uncharacterized protein LOC127836984 [Dreissena polymorpha]|uniref:Uncharacterized protein n=1 Tax=Dreissena polymorpha TaxID=45954 RepID=A0A9D4J3I1_DREPO|nr:uncharacterized protein LOC127836984 [Dreissena polymorpha]KAH3794448.1 hypothetical protein DPMN_147981 [Dreissena polymorpha]
MVYKRSEYGRNFKVSSLIKNVPVYQEHLNYRQLRRERECAHTPISWDGEVESSDSDDKLATSDKPTDVPIAQMAITEEDEENEEENTQSEDEDSVALEKKEAMKKDIEIKNLGAECSDVEIVQQSESLRKFAKEKLNKYSSKENTDQPSKSVPDKKVFGKTFLKPKQVDEKVFVKRLKPRRPDRVSNPAAARPQSAPSRRPKSASSPAPPPQPFLNYGSGSNDQTLGDKKTFNVRASSAVYSAALRAKKRNQLQVEKALERQRTASAREKKRKANFNERMARQTALWDTEYRRSYPAYEDTEYATSERDPRKRKSQFLP